MKSLPAEIARAATRERHGDVIPFAQIGDGLRIDLLDDSGQLVPADERQRHLLLAEIHTLLGGAERASPYLQQDLL